MLIPKRFLFSFNSSKFSATFVRDTAYRLSLLIYEILFLPSSEYPKMAEKWDPFSFNSIFKLRTHKILSTKINFKTL